MLDRFRRDRPGRRPDTPDSGLLSRADQGDRRIVEQALPYTMTGIPRMLALIDAVRYCEKRQLSGAFVECGVWRGGSVLAMILTLQELGIEDRDIHLYDTFEGMTAPTAEDVSDIDPPALETWAAAERQGHTAWAELFAPELTGEQAVRRLLTDTGYPEARLHFIQGPVEQTLPQAAPDELALLRLDTDWYESTRHELIHLFPRLRAGGVLLIDDYGHWQGARRAVDEYFSTEHPPLLLSRIDYTGRLAVKS